MFETKPAHYSELMRITTHDNKQELASKGVINPPAHITNSIITAWKMLASNVNNKLTSYDVNTNDYYYSMSMKSYKHAGISYNAIIMNVNNNDSIVSIACNVKLIKDKKNKDINDSNMFTCYGRNYKIENIIVKGYDLIINADNIDEASMLALSVLN